LIDKIYHSHTYQDKNIFDGSYAGPGKPKGSKNKPKIQSLTERLAALGFVTEVEAVKLYTDPNCPYGVKRDLLKLFATHEWPRAVSHTTSEHRSLQVKMNMGDTPSIEHAQTVDAVIVTDDSPTGADAVLDAPTHASVDDPES
jgi:hypothetical protein